MVLSADRGRRRRATGLVLAFALVFVFGAAPRAAGQGARKGALLRGRVMLTRVPAAAAARPSVTALGMSPRVEAPDRTRSVVYLETAPQGAFEAPESATAMLDQRNRAFVPYVLAVSVGTTVVFPNSDRTYHNVFSLSKTKRFDLGRYPRGESRSVRFDRPGVVRIFCEMHSHMNAFILVFAHRYFGTTDTEGRFRIDGVPPGTYTLAVWNDGAEREKRQVRVPEEGTDVELDVTIP